MKTIIPIRVINIRIENEGKGEMGALMQWSASSSKDTKELRTPRDLPKERRKHK